MTAKWGSISGGGGGGGGSVHFGFGSVHMGGAGYTRSTVRILGVVNEPSDEFWGHAVALATEQGFTLRWLRVLDQGGSHHWYLALLTGRGELREEVTAVEVGSDPDRCWVDALSRLGLEDVQSGP